MDVKRSINTRMWSDKWFEELTPSQKLLWIYLLTNQMTNMLGVYEISFRKISFETGLPGDTITKAFEGFERDRKAFYIDGFVVLTNWLKNQSLNSNMKVSALRTFDLLPKSLRDRLKIKASEGFESLYKGFEMLSNIEKEIESEIESESSNPSEPLFSSFYDLELTKSNGDPEYLKFVKFLFGDNGTGRPFRKLLAMNDQIGYEQFVSLKKIAVENEVKMLDTVKNLENYSKKTYTSFYLTLNNWLKPKKDVR